jgi:hypothetical protein
MTLLTQTWKRGLGRNGRLLAGRIYVTGTRKTQRFHLDVIPEAMSSM